MALPWREKRHDPEAIKAVAEEGVALGVAAHAHAAHREPKTPWSADRRWKKKATGWSFGSLRPTATEFGIQTIRTASTGAARHAERSSGLRDRQNIIAWAHTSHARRCASCLEYLLEAHAGGRRSSPANRQNGRASTVTVFLGHQSTCPIT